MHACICVCVCAACVRACVLKVCTVVVCVCVCVCVAVCVAVWTRASRGGKEVVSEGNGGRGRGKHCAEGGPDTGTYTVEGLCSVCAFILY